MTSSVRSCPHCDWDIPADAETCPTCLNPVPRAPSAGTSCRACRIAAAMAVGILLAGAALLIYSAGSR